MRAHDAQIIGGRTFAFILLAMRKGVTNVGMRYYLPLFVDICRFRIRIYAAKSPCFNPSVLVR